MTDSPVSRETVPAAAAALAGDRLDMLACYAETLAGEGVTRGLIGPREAPRLWERHLLNCAVVASAAEPGGEVADVGSGAGLPGLVWAICRPDLSLTLVEPLLRRTTFLQETVELLGLTNVRVLRARAEEIAGTHRFDVVTSRAVAPLDRLSGWCLPLVRLGGRMVAMKGASAADELVAAGPVIQRLGGTHPELVEHGRGTVEPTTWTVQVTRMHEGPRRGPGPSRGGARRRGASRWG